MRARSVMACVGWAGVTAVAMRGISGSRHMIASLAWLTRSQMPPPPVASGGRYLVLMVPLLREQRLITSIATCMTRLAAWWGSASVVLVTTEREHADRQVACTRLPDLALALSCGRPTSSFAGVLPQDRLDGLAVHARQPTARCLEAVRAEFGALESTPAMAARLAAQGDWSVPVRHYHLPDPQGTMARPG